MPVFMSMCDNNCYDFNNGYLCKNIHRVHSLFSEVSQKQENGESTDISCGVLDIRAKFRRISVQSL